MNDNDLIRLRHMLDAAREAIRFIEGTSRSDLDRNRMLVFALTRAIEIIGEELRKYRKARKNRFQKSPGPK